MNRLSILLVIFTIAPAIMHAQSDDIRIKNFNIKKGVAIEGYDAVSYFDGKPKEGKDELAFNYKGVKYLFSSTVNRDKFKASPEKYEPAYGGWCAFAMGDSGEKVKVDPETYKIHAGKLYLFYNFWGNNTLTDWNTREMQLMTKGDIAWSKFLK